MPSTEVGSKMDRYSGYDDSSQRPNAILTAQCGILRRGISGGRNWVVATVKGSVWSLLSLHMLLRV